MYLIKNKIMIMIMFSYANRQTFYELFLYEFLYHNMSVWEKVHLKL